MAKAKGGQARKNGGGAPLAFEAKRWKFDVPPAGGARFAWRQAQ